MPKKTRNQVIGEHHNKHQAKFSKQLMRAKKVKSAQPQPLPGDMATLSETLDTTLNEVEKIFTFVPEATFKLGRKQTSLGMIFLLTALLTSLSPAAATELRSPSTREKTPKAKDKQASKEKLMTVEIPAYPEASSVHAQSLSSHSMVTTKIKNSHSQPSTNLPTHPAATHLTEQLRTRVNCTPDYDISKFAGKTKAEIIDQFLRYIGELITAKPEQACRFDTLLKVKNFNIVFGEKFFNRYTKIPTNGGYQSDTHTLQVVYTPTSNIKQLKSFIVHEVHHALIHYQNEHEIKIGSTDPRLLGVPYKFSVTDTSTTIQFLQGISHGIKRTDNLLRILNTPESDLSARDISLLETYRKISSTVVGDVADTQHLTQHYIDQLMAAGTLTPSLILTHPVKLTMYKGKSYEITSYLRKIEKIAGEYVGSYYVISAPNPQKEILLLVQHKVKICKAIYYPDEKQAMTVKYPAELDAHLYEILHPYPTLYQALFPELAQNHETRYSATYRQCRADLGNRFFAASMTEPSVTSAIPASAIESRAALR
jgi:hypothetical protein